MCDMDAERNALHSFIVQIAKQYAIIKSAFEMGRKVIVPKGTNTTFDNPYIDKENTYKYYNEFMWPGTFAECISVEETIHKMKKRC